MQTSSALKIINAVIGFGVELVMIALLAIGGYNLLNTDTVVRWLLALLFPLVAIGLWAYFSAPKSSYRFKQPWLCLAQIVLFTVAAAIAYTPVGYTFIMLFLICGYGSSLLAAYLHQ